jgi:hypothetical protein
VPFRVRALSNFVRGPVASAVLTALIASKDDMTVMRRNKGWAFEAWVDDGAGGPRQVWRGGFPTRANALPAERRFLVEAEDGAKEVPYVPVAAPSPTLEAFLVDWLEHSASFDGSVLDAAASPAAFSVSTSTGRSTTSLQSTCST